jgi:hypothetical protein
MGIDGSGTGMKSGCGIWSISSPSFWKGDEGDGLLKTPTTCER